MNINVVSDVCKLILQVGVRHSLRASAHCEIDCWRERNVLFNDALNTFYLRFMASDIWLRTILIVRRKPAVAT